MSVRELVVKDVGWSGYVPFASWSGGNPPISVKGRIDLHITAKGLTLSAIEGTAFVLNGPQPPSIAFADVRGIKIGKVRLKDRYVLTVSCYKGGHHWWNKTGIGKVFLSESQFAQVASALRGLPELKNKLSIGSRRTTKRKGSTIRDASKDV
jgi:hypothetical protein